MELLTGAHPSGFVGAVTRALPVKRSYLLGRLLDRRVDMEPDRVHPDFASELVYKTGQVLRAIGADGAGATVGDAGIRLASLRAARFIQTAGPFSAYHFRSAYGLQSIETARRRGIPTICEYSIAHPLAMQPLLENSGRLPAQWRPAQLHGIWRLALDDLERADWIVVNSDFVRETFEWAGVDTTHLRVIYTGVAAQFMDAIPQRDYEPGEGPLRLLFAGEIGPRKGADGLFRALSTLKGVDWRLDLIGRVTPSISTGWSEFLGDSRVTWRSNVRIKELAALMSRAEVFVFPSLAEGSARVVAMAMAAGCYVVTTPNSGSVVQDGIHGRLVPPDDHDALAATLMEVADQRRTLPLAGRANADLIRREYLVEHYVDRVISFYEEILGDDPPGPSPEGLKHAV